jgi:NADH-quinone oxidoreductase subunit L
MVMILLVTGVGFLIHVYSVGYMAEDPGYARFFSYLNLFISAMSLLVLADNYLLMFVGWEGVGLCSYLLIGFYFDRKSAGDAAKKAFVVNRVGDFGFALGMMLLFSTFGSLDYGQVFERVGERGAETGFGVLSAIALLLFVGATGKSAQLPLYVWLPDAMEGPTPVSALIHAATMVTAGVYMVVRSNAIFSRAPQVLWIVAVVGIATALFAATIGLVQRDIKRVLAYSTVSQLGYMFTALGVGAFAAGVFHLMTHAFFKALLFLGSGSVIHGMHHEQDMMRMGGLKKYMPWTCRTMWVGTLAIAGVPLLSGFFSKDEILWRAWSSPQGSPVIWGLGVVTAGLTAFYMFRLMFLTFHGKERFGGGGEGHAEEAHHGQASGHADAGEHTRVHPHESPWLMVGPLVVLALLSGVGGYVMVPSWFPVGSQGLEHFLEPVLEHQYVAHAAEHAAGSGLEIGLTLVSVMVALAGMGLAYFLYLARPELPARIASRFQLLYNTLLNKYYVDEIYDAAIVKPIRQTSESLLWRGIDVGLIDGTVNGFAATVQNAGNLLKRMQNGYTRAYATWILCGAFVVLLYLVARY